MCMTPRFTNAKLEALSQECGLVIEPESMMVTSSELEFFIDKLIDKLIFVVQDSHDFGVNHIRTLAEIKTWKTENA